MARLCSQEHELASNFLPLTNNISFEKWTRLGRQNHADPQCLSLTSEREQVPSWLELHVSACVTEAACSMALKVGASRCPSSCSTPTAGTQGSHPPPAGRLWGGSAISSEDTGDHCPTTPVGPFPPVSPASSRGDLVVLSQVGLKLCWMREGSAFLVRNELLSPAI